MYSHFNQFISSICIIYTASHDAYMSKEFSLAEENLITRAETLRVESIAVDVDGKLFV